MKYDVPHVRLEMDRLHGYLATPHSPEEEWAWWETNCPILLILFKIQRYGEHHRRKEDVFKDFCNDAYVQQFIKDVENHLK